MPIGRPTAFLKKMFPHNMNDPIELPEYKIPRNNKIRMLWIHKENFQSECTLCVFLAFCLANLTNDL